MNASIEVPDLARDGSHVVIASVSGGKDSTALMLALREADVPARYVFSDTGCVERAIEARAPGRAATFFRTRQSGPSFPVTIRNAVAWSRTTRGGRQLPLLADAPSGGCMRWGMCEPPEPRELPEPTEAEIEAAALDDTGDDWPAVAEVSP